jgi:hypothetical protein
LILSEPARVAYDARVTRFAVCFLLVFGELAFGGMFALAIPPFAQVERGFYKSSASVFLTAGALTAVGLALLAMRSVAPISPGPVELWTLAALWILYCVIVAIYLRTLWNDNERLRARTYTLGLAAGLIAVVASIVALRPAGLGIAGIAAYAMIGVISSLVLGLVTGAMLFGHWYLIDLDMPVDYLRSFVRVLAVVLVLDVAAMALAIAVIWLGGGTLGAHAVDTLLGAHLELLAVRIVLGPAALIALTWMCWQTLKIPQTMAATGLLYIAMMAAIVGEMLGRFILFRTAIPL